MNQQINKLFIKDQNIPIHLSHPSYFYYLLDLYEPWLHMKDKYNLLINEINSFESIDLWYNKKNETIDFIKNQIKASNAYKTIEDLNFSNQYVIQGKKFPSNNIFTNQNINKNLLSIDMKKANWQMWSILGLSNDTYEDYIQKLGASNYQSTSKMLRQVLFGELFPNRIQTMEKYFSFKAGEALSKNNYNVLTCTADEIICELSDRDNVNTIKSILNNTTPEIQWRFELWNLTPISIEKNWILQTNLTENSIKFRNVPKHYTPQVFKHHFNLPLIYDNDLIFEYEGELSKFLKPLDLQQKPKIKNKI